jgi:hypothetical protein
MDNLLLWFQFSVPKDGNMGFQRVETNSYSRKNDTLSEMSFADNFPSFNVNGVPRRKEKTVSTAIRRNRSDILCDYTVLHSYTLFSLWIWNYYGFLR